MRRLTVDQVIILHEKMIQATGGSAGLRDKDLLESSINNAYNTFDGSDLYPSVEEKCANICYSIIKNHPFTDGNKRMGIYILLIILEYSGISLKYTQTELVELGLSVADGRYNQSSINEWIILHRI